MCSGCGIYSMAYLFLGAGCGPTLKHTHAYTRTHALTHAHKHMHTKIKGPHTCPSSAPVTLTTLDHTFYPLIGSCLEIGSLMARLLLVARWAGALQSGLETGRGLEGGEKKKHGGEDRVRQGGEEWKGGKGVQRGVCGPKDRRQIRGKSRLHAGNLIAFDLPLPSRETVYIVRCSRATGVCK